MTDIHPDLPELFDLDYGEVADDLPFFESLAQRCERPILELGVGAGRVAIPLARAGFVVWGIDVSDAMLDYARGIAGELPTLHLIAGDMSDFQLDERFDLIFAGLGGFHHLLSPDDQLGCLRCVERHLAPGGLFVCDLRPLLWEDWDSGESTPLLHDWTRQLPTGETVVKFRSVHADLERQIKRDTSIYDRVSDDGTVRRVVSEVDLRFTTRYEMEGLVRDAGLELDRMYGEYDLSPYDENSEYLITVARKPGKEAP